MPVGESWKGLADVNYLPEERQTDAEFSAADSGDGWATMAKTHKKTWKKFTEFIS